MRSWGWFLIVLAVGSVLLRYFGMYFILLFWIDHWGQTVGWIIRAAMAMTGIAMITFAPKAPAPQPPAVAPPDQPIR